MLKELKVRRAKGVLIIELGSYTFNKENTELTYKKVTASTNNLIELIDTDNNALNKEQQLEFHL